MPTILRRLRYGLWRLYRRPMLFAATALALASATVVVVGDPGAGPQRDVIVLARDVAIGSALSADDVERDRRPVAHVPTTAVADDPVGRVTNSALSAGEVLIEPRLGAPGTSRLAALLPAGAVGVTVPRDGAPPGIDVGDRLDLVGVDAALGPVLLATGAQVIGADDRSLAVAVPTATAVDVVAALTAGWVVPVLSGSP